MRKCAGGKKPRSDHFGDASPPPSLSLRPRSLLMTLKSEAKYSSGGGRAPRGSSIRRLLLSKSLLTRRDVKRSHVSPPPQKKKKEKKKRRMKTPLSLSPLSLSLSLSLRRRRRQRHEQKVEQKVSSFSSSLPFFFCAARWAWTKGKKRF